MAWRTIAPLSRYCDSSILSRVPLELSHGVILRDVPEFARSESVLKEVGGTQRDDLTKRTLYALEAPGKGADDPHDGGRPGAIRGSTRLSTAVQALWLAQPTNLSYELLLHFEGDENRLAGCYVFDRSTALGDYINASLTVDDVATAGGLHAAILALPRDATLWLALSIMTVARQDQHPEIKYLMTWVAIEALFGSERWRGEVKGPLAGRVARFFGATSPVPKGRVVKLYELRSTVAHGLRGINYEALPSALLDSQELVRMALRRILADTELCRTFDSGERDSFLGRRA